MLKVIQVGVGGYGAWWLPTVSETDAVTHVGLVDVNPEALGKQGRLLGFLRRLASQVYRKLLYRLMLTLFCVLCHPHNTRK